MSSIWKQLVDPDESLFYSRGEKGDIRLGDLVKRGEKNFSLDVQVGILGVPQDEGVKRNKGRVGAAEGPDAVRQALYRLTPFEIGSEDNITILSLFDFGNLVVRGSLEDIHGRLQDVVETILNLGITPIVLGGGHDITFPDFVAFAKEKKSVGLINIDSHFDVREPSPQRTSGTSFRQVLDNSTTLILPQNFVEVGIQPYANARTHYEYLLDRGSTVFTLREIQERGVDKIVSVSYEIAGKLTEAVFVSFDLDVVRGSDAPGVSASSPSGLAAEDLLKIARYVGLQRKTQMIDIVELNPKYDVDSRTAKLAALTILNFLTGVANRV
ncbi:MAG TPA: formimidoylglutamase [Bacteroidota bacterium]